MINEPYSQIPSKLKIALGLLLILWLATLSVHKIFQAGLSYQELNHWQNPRSTNDTVSLSGEGKVVAIPDVAIISLSVENRSKTVAAVQQDSNKKMNDIVSYLKGLDIDKKDIKTTNYNLRPLYAYNQETGKQIFDGYELNQTIEVKIRQLDKASQVLDGALSKGANQIGQLNFTVDNPEQLRNEARLKAIAQAKEKALALAEAAGVKLGKVRSFSENTNSPTPYRNYLSQDLSYAESAKTIAPTIEAGSQEIIVQVTMSFEIE
ncbi:SIMPL domain-containing protein [Patescibacteria group bacterium]|nr:SIMPL domain-containing protein [Patescibacteria group bacterium]